MKTIFWGLWFLLSVVSSYDVAGLTEHKVHNIVLYPDKHSWCKTTEIKQIVAYPGCNSVEIDNNVCVGACFSYSIPRTIPSAPGEVIIPYCDCCQPVEYEWREVTLTCSDESEEEEGQTEMTKRVQVITNCSCNSCEKQHEEKKVSDHQKHTSSKSSDDIPELMSLMMGMHNKRSEAKDSEEDEEMAEDVNVEQEVPIEKASENSELKQDEKENLIEDDDDDDEKRIKTNLEKESRTLEILHLSKHHRNSSQKINDLIEIAKSEHKHYEFGPHHSLIIKPNDDIEEIPVHSHHKKHHGEDDEETPSLLENQFKIHNDEEYMDQIAVESNHKEVREKKIMSVPDMIYNASMKDGKWRNGVRMLEVSHHHLQPAREGIELSYYGKSETKEDDKLDNDE